MDNINNINVFAAILLEEHQNRNAFRITRRTLRDTHNAFEMPEISFKQMFRLDKQSVINLIDDITPHYVQRGQIPLHLKVLAALNFFGTGSFQNPVGVNMYIALSQPVVSRIINEISTLISNFVYPDWVKFPSTLEDKNEIKTGFYDKWNIRGVLGAIDGTHVEILAPPEIDVEYPPYVYINRKGKHSINVMLIVDSNTKIIGCNARFPGSVHDAAIWQTSEIRNYLRTEYINGDRFSHLLGDSGYPLEPWLFTPFNNPEEGSPEARFNEQFISVRNVVERTNGSLKGRFRCLSRHRVLMYHPTKAARIVQTCCTLHNMALRANLVLPQNEVEYWEDIGGEANNQDFDNFQEGRDLRNQYVLKNFH